MSVDEIVIFGGKGTAVNIAEQIEDARLRFGHPMTVRGFAIDDPALGKSIAGFPVVCGTRDIADLLSEKSVKFIYALYRPDVMKERIQLLRSLSLPPDRLATFIHPLATVGRSVQIGSGTVILAQATVASRVSIGQCAIVNSHVYVEHEATIENSCFLAVGAIIGSHSRVKEGTFVGLGATIREDVTLGPYAFIGMGAVVTRTVEEATTVFGNPARAKQ